MLGFIPVNKKVRVFTAGKTDNFGLAVPDTVGEVYECRFSFNTEYKKILISDGSEIIFIASMLFPDPEQVNIKVDDKVEFTDDSGTLQTKAVKLVQYKRDFSGAVTTVKAVI